MPTDIERLIVSMEARTASFEREMKRAQGQVSASTKRIESDFTNLNSHIKNTLSQGTSIVRSGLGGLAAGVSAALSVRGLTQYADAWQAAANKIAAAGEDAGRVPSRLSQLTDKALATRTGLEATVDLYTGLRRATEDLAPSQAQLLKATENINKSFVVGGAGTQAQAAGILQLTQALQSGALQGDELRSIRENAPLIAKAIADTMGVSIGKLKELGAEGKITSDIILRAVLGMGASIDAQFNATIPTIEQSFANLRTSVTRYAGEIDQAYGISGTISRGILGLSANIDTTAKVAGLLGIALLTAFGPAAALIGPIGAGITVAGTALALFGDQIRPIAGDLATMADYAVASFQLVKQSGSQAWDAISASLRVAADTISGVLNGIPVAGGDAFGALFNVTKSVLNAVIGGFVFAGQTIGATWNNLGSAMAEVIVNSMNAVIRTIEAALQKIIGAVNAVTGAVGITAIPTPQLSRVENAYAGAGKAAADAYGKAFGSLTKDYIGDAVGSIDAVLAKIRAEANNRAGNRSELGRETQRGNARLSDGDINQKLRPPKASNAAGSGSGGGGPEKKEQSEFDRELANTEKRIIALGREKEALSLSNFEAAKSEAAFKLLDAAKAAGIPINDALRERIDGVAAAVASAKVALDDAKVSQQAFNDLQKFIGGSLSGFFSDIVSGGENAQKALSNLVKKLADAALQAALLGEGPLGKFFGLAGTNGAPGGIIGSIFSAFTGASGKALGGPVRGGVPITVGENGRETFVPSTNGRIVPNGKFGGGGSGTVVINADFRGADASAVAAISGKLDQLKAQIPSMVMQTNAASIRRGIA